MSMDDATSDRISTEALVLRISPCRENGAVVSCLSPQLGRMAFYLPDGAGRRRASAIHCDLFQVLQLQCQPSARPDDDDFYRIGEAELVDDFSAIATDYAAYQATCWLGAFALRNAQPRLPMPRFFEAMKIGLRRLCLHEAGPDAVLTGTGLVFLYEGGWLNTSSMSPQEVSQCELLINMALELAPAPALSEDLWKRLWEWTQGRLIECLPD